jgi:hypothetical protein
MAICLSLKTAGIEGAGFVARSTLPFLERMPPQLGETVEPDLVVLKKKL